MRSCSRSRHHRSLTVEPLEARILLSGPAAQLAFVQPPTNARAGSIIAPAVTVDVEDANGHVVTSNNSDVTLSIVSPATDSGVLSGTLTEQAVNGVATFSNLSISSAGIYTLHATDTDKGTVLTPATSPSFTMTAPPPASGYNLKTLASFSGTNGEAPQAGLIMDGSGNLYGTTYMGGADGDGSVFEIKAGSNAITPLASFAGLNGASPYAGLIMDGSGNLYGTTAFGGPGWTGSYGSGNGTVFEIKAGSNTITTLASFNGVTGNGLNPEGGLVMDGSGNLYGTTELGGYDGNIFEIAAGSNTITTLASFNLTNGDEPMASLIMDGSGNLYGTTEFGGGEGNVFELEAGSDTVIPLASFTYNGENGNGEMPLGGVIMDASGNLYGTTEYGGPYNEGTVFEIKAASIVAGSPAITTLASFDASSTSGGDPVASLIMDGSGNLYGTTETGGPAGTVFEIKAGSSTITTLASFNNTDGNQPESSLIMDGNGDLYGTTLTGGADGTGGTVFELTRVTPKLAFAQQPTNTPAGSAISPAVTVDIEDAAGQVVTSDDSNVTLTISSGTLNGTATVAAVNGVATFSGLSTDQAGTYTLTASDSADSLSGLTSNSFNVTPAAASKLVFSTEPVGGTAGAVLPAVKVTVEDTYGNVLTSDNSQVTLALNGGSFAGGTATETALSGVATFGDLVIDTAGSYTLTAADSADNLSGFVSSGFTVNPATASKLVFTAEPADGTAGAVLPAVKVAIEDTYGNIVTTGNSQVTLALNGGSFAGGTTTETASSGVATFGDLLIDKAGNGYTLMAADSADSLSGFTSNSFTISAAAPSKLAFTAEPAGGTAGAVLTPVDVAIEDQYGNVVTDDSSQVGLALNGASFASGTTTETASSGVATFGDLVIDVAGAYTLTASDNADHLSDATSNGFTISPAPASKLVFTAAPAGGYAGETLATTTVVVEDQYNNVVMDDTSSVVVGIGPGSSGSGTLSGTQSEPVVNGVATFSDLSISATGSYTLQATDSELPAATAATASFTLMNPPATLAFVQPQSAGPAGGPITDSDGNPVTVDVEDAGGNIVTSDNSSVTVTLNTGNFSNPKANGASETVAVVNGQATFSDLTINQAGSYTLTATDSELPSSAPTSSVTITPGQADELVFTTEPANGLARATLAPVNVTIEDQYGNPETSDSSDVTVTLSTGTFCDGHTSETATAAAGVATFSNLSVSQSGSYTLTAADSADGLTGPSASGSFVISPATDLTAQFGSITLPAPSVPGDRGNVTVAVTNQGQVSATGSMTLDLYASTDQSVQDGVLLSVLKNQRVKLGYNQSQKYTFSNVQLPASLQAGPYYLLAVVNATQSIPESNYANDTASTSGQMVYEFGTVGTRKGVVLKLTEADGTVASFSLSGAGMGDVTVSGEEWDLTVTGTGAKSGVTITTKAPTKSASGLLSLDDITVSGPLGTFSGTGVTVTGTMTVSGSLGTLSLSTSGGKSPVGGNILAGAIVNAGSIGTLRVAGSFLGTSAAGISFNAASVGILTVTGAMDYTQLFSTGNIGSVSLGSMTDSDVFAGVATGVTGLPSTSADFSSESDSIKSFTITGGSTAAESFINSNIAAWTIGTLNLGYPDGSNDGTQFGVACNKYTTLSFRNSSGKVTTWKYPKAGTFAAADGVVNIIKS